MPLAGFHAPRAVDADLAWRGDLVGRLADERVAEVLWHAARCDVGLVVMDLHELDARDRERRRGEHTRDFGGEPLVRVLLVDPVADLEPIRAATAMQSCTPDRFAVEEDPEDDVAAIEPRAFPRVEERSAVSVGERLELDPGHPR